jgi:mono/diheme cytochrome c family protein
MNRGKLALVLIAGVTCALSLPLMAEVQIKREAARPIASVEGVDSFNSYCAVCHGKTGKGDGPAVPALKTPVPDLTTFAQRHGGKFSSVEVELAISGTDKRMPAHGAPDMPIWGPVFSSLDHDDGSRALRMANLVKYIESLQK